MSTLTMYNFSKRKNSTAAPATAGVDFDVTLKDRTDILNPVFRLALASFPAYNYAQFLGRYYFVTGVESVTSDIWDISCSVDVLATYKSAIQNTSAFVLYDTTTNTEVIDTRLSTKTTKTVTTGSASFTMFNGSSAVVSITGRNTTSSYAITVPQAQGLLAKVSTWMDDSSGADLPDRVRIDDGGSSIFSSVEDALQDVSDSLIKGFRSMVSTGKVGDCIKSAFVVPVDLTNEWTINANLYLGEYPARDSSNNQIVGKRIPLGAGRVITDSVAISIPWQFTDWRRNSPYTELYCYIPFVGMVHLNASELIDETVLNIFALLDGATGDLLMVLSASGRRIGQYNTNIAAQMPIGASNFTPMQTATAIGSAVAGVGATIASGGSIFPATAGLIGVLTNSQPTVTTIGSNTGGIALAIERTAYVFCVTHDTNVSPDSVSAIMGTPARAVKSLSGLSGYVQTVGASVAGLMTDSERDAINNLLNGGVYIE